MEITPATFTNNLLKYYTYAFNFILVSAYIGIGISKPLWMTTVDYYLKIFVSLFLLYRFNPFRQRIMLEDLDRRIIFTGAIIIFTSTVLNQILLTYSEKYKIHLTDILKN
jgi:hypothetical protein